MQRSGGGSMGQRDNFASNDVEKLNNMYCRGQRPIPVDTEDNADGSDDINERPTPAPQRPFWNLIGSLVSSAFGSGGRSAPTDTIQIN